jgi:transposase
VPNVEHLAQITVHPDPAMAIDMNATLFVALELSLSSWVVMASAPGENKASKHGVAACDGAGLLSVLKRLRERAERRLRHPVAVLVMQEAGRDGFWIHRLLEAHTMRSVVVDPASIAVNRRSRRAKTDRIDAEAMLRTLMAWARGERQVCAMVRPPTREAEDARRLSREREALLAERIRHANRIKGLLATQGVFGFEPTSRDRRTRLAAVRTPEGTALPPRLAAEIGRQMDRLELAMQQLAAVEAARDAVLASGHVACPASDVAAGQGATTAPMPGPETAGARLLQLKGIGPETASVLANEAFFRDFRNRREVASYAGCRIAVSRSSPTPVSRP